MDTNLIRNFQQMALERIYLIHVVPKTDAASVQFREEIPLQVSPWIAIVFSENGPCLRTQKVDYLLLLFKDVFSELLKEFQTYHKRDRVESYMVGFVL